jgi:lysozyme
MTAEEFIEKHEGRKLIPYKCPAGFRTIGIGWNFDSNPLPPSIKTYLKNNGKITNDMANLLLSISIKVATSDCEDLFPEFDNFSNDRKIALIDFLFQLGKTRASKFVHAIAAINTGHWNDVANEMRNSNWFKEVPNRAQEVTDLIENG